MALPIGVISLTNGLQTQIQHAQSDQKAADKGQLVPMRRTNHNNYGNRRSLMAPTLVCREH